jgi:ribosomal protein S3
MGQKVHPLGFRVGITKKHQSQWFARFNKYAYSQSIVEDHMLRQTLKKVFPDLLNPVFKKTQNSSPSSSSQETAITPRITHIQIERGLIPYEIGIQIHAENCELIKSAIDNLKVNRELLNNLQKTRQYLSRVVSPLTNLDGNSNILTESDNNNKQDSSESGPTLENKSLTKKRTFQKTLKKGSAIQARQRYGGRSGSIGGAAKTKKRPEALAKKGLGIGLNKISSANFKSSINGVRTARKVRLSKEDFLKLKNLKKRLKKRQLIRNRYLQIISKGLFLRKNGNQIIRKVSLKGFVKKYQSFKKTKIANTKLNYQVPFGKLKLSVTASNKAGSFSQLKADNKNSNNNGSFNSKALGSNKLVAKLSNKLSKKFAALYLNKVNKKFLISLKALMKHWHKQSQNNTTAESGLVLPLGYKIRSAGRINTIVGQAPIGAWPFANMPISKLTNLIDVLEKKSLKKMELLRKDFLGFGTISKTRSFGYYEIITLLKQLKELVNKLKKQTTLNKSKFQKTSFNLTAGKSKEKANLSTRSLLAKANTKKSLTQNVFNSVVNNLDNECRKIKFISYLQNIVKKHRNENIFYYLSSMAVANKDYRELKRYTLKHSSFLFGLDTNSLSTENLKAYSPEANKNEEFKTLQEKIEKVLLQSNRKYDFDKNLQDAFLEQVETQRNMYKSNLALTPKISIKFFSVKTENILEKASVVADSVVDALEKRKAFRGVIKKAKEDLMRRSRVKGVKIQVAGRLNGAEIARSEWVRAGRVPLQTLRANIDYSYRTASTIYGIIGVKVWIFKGYN